MFRCLASQRFNRDNATLDGLAKDRGRISKYVAEGELEAQRRSGSLALVVDSFGDWVRVFWSNHGRGGGRHSCPDWRGVGSHKV